MRSFRFPTVLLALAATLALVDPLPAYTIYLKDGSRLMAREKYTVEGERALITLENGTRTFMAAAEIDAPRTDEANRGNYGTALILEDGKVKEMREAVALPKRVATLFEKTQQSQGPGTDRPLARRQAQPSEPSPRTAGGAVDFGSSSRVPWTELDVAAELRQFFRAQGLEDVGVYRGSEAGRPLVEVTTSSEASVFRALATGAVALRDLRARHGDRLRGIDLLLTTAARERAGQFRLDPEMAAELVERRVEISQFYVRYLQF
jgi:hypothetical protein